ncbi:hypothetical protein FHY55_17540 [Oceanicola sp. D3]|uniref:hypothetical protein n=1 Tax=Oceanicola sp. D3 TaxID=2587163 RepID=UPI00111E5E57|nr:hypothetical protein [Oceanicola sp. D3]QDC10928.1 hypothetical protein FHY55_17540 [Oceanicola sp. D3]
MIGEGLGFIVPELLIWLITTIIAALSAGAGAAALAARCASIASKIRAAISGGQHVAKILAFLDGIKPIFSKIGALVKKLRQSIDETVEGILSKGHRAERSARYWRKRLDELAGQGHGPQKHEGDVTDIQLYERVFEGKDPMTGTVRRNEKGRILGVGKHSTKFNTPADYVRAYEAVLKHPDFAKFASSNRLRDEIPLSMKKVFGPDFQNRIRGYSILSGKVGENPVIGETAFGPDTEIIARFRRENGRVLLTTLFPNP